MAVFTMTCMAESSEGARVLLVVEQLASDAELVGGAAPTFEVIVQTLYIFPISS